MKRTLLFAFLLFWIFAEGQELKSPSEFLGYELGTRFTRHHRVVDYCTYLSETVPEMVQLQEYGQSYEDRPLLLLYLSTPENISRLEAIRTEHLESINGGEGSGKAIVWLSYNVHGNESVSTEAAMETLFKLLTSKKAYLENSIVIVDPCVNPDGRDRYVNWYYESGNTPLQVNPDSREHHEGWHSGRSNHYMFDLNRDWAWLSQQESRYRLAQYNKWMPHIHVDFHEQGVDYPYFFAPAAEPFHEVITDFQREFQGTIGANHARYFDQKGWLYFTRERFDLFYPSYGDTYPTYNGAIGMTYEQGGGGRAGLAVITQSGDTLTLKDRIEHHLATGLSTVETSSLNSDRLNQEFSKYFGPKNFRFQSYVLRGNKDHLRTLTAWLDQHGIKYGGTSAKTVKGFAYRSGKSETFNIDQNTLVVSTDQPKGRLVKVLFEPDAKLSDSLTYDITAWSLPYAYGLEALASESKVPTSLFRRDTLEPIEADPSAYAYITDWNSMVDARFLSSLLQKGIRVRSAQEPFSVEGKSYKRGSLIITKKDNASIQDLPATLTALSAEYKKEVAVSKTGRVDDGRDFGSRHVKLIQKPQVAVLSGEPTSSLSFGEIWHYFERQLNYPMTAIDGERLDNIQLKNYDILILPHGDAYQKFMNEETRTRLGSWVEDGGKLILIGGALKAFANQEGFGIKARQLKKDSIKTASDNYERSARDRLKEEVKGAIFEASLDQTHPLAFGYGDIYYTLKIKNGSYEYLDQGNVAVLGEVTEPKAGFSGSDTAERLRKSLVFGAESKGNGHVIYMVDNPLFRGFWENGKLFFANALFMLN